MVREMQALFFFLLWNDRLTWLVLFTATVEGSKANFELHSIGGMLLKFITIVATLNFIDPLTKYITLA